MNMTRVLLVLPPFTQLNTPYPSTAYLTGFLRAQGFQAFQCDAGIETALKLFSLKGLTALFEEVQAWALRPEQQAGLAAEVVHFLDHRDQYLDTIEPVISFLQNRDLTLAHRIVHGALLPEGPRFAAIEDESWAFGPLGVTDQARHLCTLYLDDLADLLTGTISPHFGLTRYAERLAASASSFEPLHALLSAPPGLVDRLLGEVISEALERTQPDVVGFSVPFPGNLYGALRGAWWVKRLRPGTKTLLGGGYVNTELRELMEPRLFETIDFVTLDDGERPILTVLDHLAGRRPETELRRTFVSLDGMVTYFDGAAEHDIPASLIGTPTYDGLPIHRYLSVLEVLNPMHRLWSDGRWNKLTLAHGCYWRKCSFCDVTLDYIGRYDPAPAELVVDRMQALVAETGQTGFHFVDEAAPPLLLRDVALVLLERGVSVSWWGNIRFEKTFSPDLCRLLAAAGCIAVSGGLEVASDRLLARMKKGVTVEQVARVAQAFTQAGVMVHAYLMYGFPTETETETIDSLERVRQLFDAGVIQSGFWHRFVTTRHAPIGQNPAEFEIQLVPAAHPPFAANDLEHRDPKGCDHDRYSAGLDRAVRNYMVGQGLETDVRKWFEFKVPVPKVDKQLIEKALGVAGRSDEALARTHRLIWLGAPIQPVPVAAAGRVGLVLQARGERETVHLPVEQAQWLQDTLMSARPRRREGRAYETLEQALGRFPGSKGQEFLSGRIWKKVRELGAVLV